MKTAIIYSTMLSIGALGSAFTWGPGAVETTRDYMIAPALEAIKEKNEHDKIVMFSMKQYDIRTDELAADRDSLQSTINEYRALLDATPASEAAYRRHLEKEIRRLEQELQKKQRALDQAEDNDRDILESIHRSTA